MKISPAELAQRLAEADRRLLLLRRATIEMQAVRKHLLAKRREPERSDRNSDPRR